MATTAGFPVLSAANILNWNTVVGVCAGLLLAIKNFRDNRFKILLLWFFIPVLFIASGRISVNEDSTNHYFLVLYPVQFILFALIFDRLLEYLNSKTRYLVFVAAGLALLICLFQFTVSFKFTNYIRSNENIEWMGYGPPYKYRVSEIKRIIRKKNPGFQGLQNILNPDGKRFKYDPDATRYIHRYINEL